VVVLLLATPSFPPTQVGEPCLVRRRGRPVQVPLALRNKRMEAFRQRTHGDLDDLHDLKTSSLVSDSVRTEDWSVKDYSSHSGGGGGGGCTGGGKWAGPELSEQAVLAEGWEVPWVVMRGTVTARRKVRNSAATKRWKLAAKKTAAAAAKAAKAAGGAGGSAGKGARAKGSVTFGGLAEEPISPAGALVSNLEMGFPASGSRPPNGDDGSTFAGRNGAAGGGSARLGGGGGDGGIGFNSGSDDVLAAAAATAAAQGVGASPLRVGTLGSKLRGGGGGGVSAAMSGSVGGTVAGSGLFQGSVGGESTFGGGASLANESGFIGLEGQAGSYSALSPVGAGGSAVLGGSAADLGVRAGLLPGNEDCDHRGRPYVVEDFVYTVAFDADADEVPLGQYGRVLGFPGTEEEDDEVGGEFDVDDEEEEEAEKDDENMENDDGEEDEEDSDTEEEEEDAGFNQHNASLAAGSLATASGWSGGGAGLPGHGAASWALPLQSHEQPLGQRASSSIGFGTASFGHASGAASWGASVGASEGASGVGMAPSVGIVGMGAGVVGEGSSVADSVLSLTMSGVEAPALRRVPRRLLAKERRMQREEARRKEVQQQTTTSLWRVFVCVCVFVCVSYVCVSTVAP